MSPTIRSTSEAIKVVFRVRPLNSKEIKDGRTMWVLHIIGSIDRLIFIYSFVLNVVYEYVPHAATISWYLTIYSAHIGINVE